MASLIDLARLYASDGREGNPGKGTRWGPMKLPAAVRRCAIYIANAADPRRHGGEMSLWLRMPYRRSD